MTRDGTVKPVSRDQILRHARGREELISPVQLTTSRIANHIWFMSSYPPDSLLCVMTKHTYPIECTEGVCRKREAHISWSMMGLPE